MSKLAFLFPGQASQYPGMGRDLAENFPESRAVFDEADAALGFSISKFASKAPKNAQTHRKHAARDSHRFRGGVSRARKRTASRLISLPGHSLASIQRWWRQDLWPLGTAVKLTRQRGRYMQEAVPAGEGAMAAILGLSPVRRSRYLQEGRGRRSGLAREFEFARADGDFRPRAAVKRAVEIASQARSQARRDPSRLGSFSLLADGAAHSGPRTRPARRCFRPLRFPLITNVDAEAIASGEEARNA
jgi:malonyl CoA-acyl carrier protein transacylase